MTPHTRFTPWTRVSLYIFLACLLHSSLCMLMSKSFLQPFFGYARSVCFICVCCVRHEGLFFTHTRSHIHCHASILSIMNDQSQVSCLSLAPSVSHVERVCSDGLFVWLSSHSSVCLYDHLCIFPLFTHLVIFCWIYDDQASHWQLDHHLAFNSIDCQPEQRRSTKLVISSCATCKKFYQHSCWPPKQSTNCSSHKLCNAHENASHYPSVSSTQKLRRDD